MFALFAELKRRHVYRVAAAYAVVAWVLLQLFNNVEPILKLPDWAGALVLVLLLGGFPVALLLAWIHQLAPADGATARATTGKLDWALIGALVVVIALVSYQQLVPSSGGRTAQQVATAPAGVTPQPGGISIAVLPFANLSGDAAQEFFSDGMTEEITSALAKVPTLRMVGRTSAFQFKGQSKDLRAIGQALGAIYLIEGSVRKAGDRVRVTAQLVKADDGIGLWTDNYDRDLKDIFATQEDIAQAIAGALRVPLGLKQGETLVANRTSDLDSYQKYLQAKALVRARAQNTDATALLEQVVARDPGYAPGWALLAQAYALTPNNQPALRNGALEGFRRIVDTFFPKAEAAARRAIQLDANLADGYVSLGLVQRDRGKFLLAEDSFKQALALDANNPDVLHFYSDLLAGVGRLRESLAVKQRVQVLEPFVPIFNANAAAVMWLNGQNDAALAIFNTLPAVNRAIGLPIIYASMGRYSEAADALLEVPSGFYSPGMVDAVVRLLRTAPAKVASPQTLPRLGFLEFVYLYVGAPNRILEFYEDSVEAGYEVPIGIALLWHSSYAPVRKTERFKAFARKAGLVDYWRARGWPEFCHPTIGDDFACE